MTYGQGGWVDRNDRNRVVEDWIRLLGTGQVSRRAFVRRMAVLGMSVGTIGTLLDACTRSPNTPSVTGSVSETPKKGGTLNVAYLDEIAQLEPHTSPGVSSVRFFQLVYSTLLRFDNNMNPIPDVAESFDVTPDGLTYTFVLRPGLKFSNGMPLTAEDVKFTFDRILDPKIAAIGSSYYSQVDSVETKGHDTVLFHMRTPSAAIPVYVAGPESIIISKQVAQSGDLTKIDNAIGSGPFKVDNWVPDSHMDLSRNPYFYEAGKPYLDGVRVAIVPDTVSMLAGFRQGTIDFTNSIDARFGKEAGTAATVAKASDIGYYLLFMQTAVDPLTDQRVRDALNYALDRQEIINASSLGEGVVSGPIPAASKQYALDTSRWPQYTTDRKKAADLLTQAGVGDGFSFTMLTQKTDPVNAPLIAQTVQAQWGQIGVRADIQLMEFNAWVQHWLKATFTVVPGNNSGLPDPDAYLYRWFHSKGDLNFVTGHWSTPDLDQALDKGREETDPDARKAQYDMAQDILVEGAPFLWLYSGYVYAVTSSKVRGYVPLSDESVTNLRNTWLAG